MLPRMLPKDFLPKKSPTAAQKTGIEASSTQYNAVKNHSVHSELLQSIGSTAMNPRNKQNVTNFSLWTKSAIQPRRKWIGRLKSANPANRTEASVSLMPFHTIIGMKWVV